MSSRRSYRDDGEESRALLHDDIGLETLHIKKRDEDRSPSRQQPRDQTIETDIQPSDTLLTLSLKYNVALAELKRVNNFIRDDEFYALKRIKIPVRPTSLLTELLPGVNSDENRNNNGWYIESKESPTSFGSSAVSSGGQSSPEMGSSPFSELSRDLGEAAPVVGNLLGVDELAPTSNVFHESRDKKKVKRMFRELDRDLDRIKEKQTELETSEDQLPPLDETGGSKGFPLKSSQIPTEDPGCSNRVLGCWCVVVGVLIILVFLVLVSLMRIQHDTIHSKDLEDLEKISSKIAKDKL